MSRVYEALKKAEREREKKTARIAVSKKDREDKQRVALTEISKQVDDLLVTLQAPLSYSADEFMKVCVHIAQNGVQDGQHDKRERVVLITSALLQEGKTMATANLAIGLASLPGTTVTLIDADLKKPELHKMLGISVDKGLSEYLEEEEGADFSEIYYDTPIPRLFIIPGGKAYSQPSRIFSSDKLQRLLKMLQTKHPKGYTVIDAPPMLLSTEFEILLNNVDSVIMVVRYGKTRRDNLQKALGLVDKKKIMGIILNR
jgi:capsular exopolysaccharide synthesis family protein